MQHIGFFWYTLHIGTLYSGFCMVITVWYNRTHVSRHMCDAFTHFIDLGVWQKNTHVL